MKNAGSNENLNTDLANIFTAIEGSAVGFQSEEAIKGLFKDLDTTSDRLGATVAEKNKRLCDILKGIAEVDFNDFQSNDIDAFGDAYEYLISIMQVMPENQVVSSLHRRLCPSCLQGL